MGGWSRAQVSQYAMLNKICKEAWETITTSFQNTVAEDDDDAVAEIATGVAKPGEKIGAKVSANLREPSDDTVRANLPEREESGKSADQAAAVVSVSPRCGGRYQAVAHTGAEIWCIDGIIRRAISYASPISGHSGIRSVAVWPSISVTCQTTERVGSVVSQSGKKGLPSQYSMLPIFFMAVLSLCAAVGATAGVSGAIGSGSGIGGGSVAGAACCCGSVGCAVGAGAGGACHVVVLSEVAGADCRVAGLPWWAASRASISAGEYRP